MLCMTCLPAALSCTLLLPLVGCLSILQGPLAVQVIRWVLKRLSSDACRLGIVSHGLTQSTRLAIPGVQEIE